MISLKKYIHYLPSQDRIGSCTACSVLLAVEIILAIEGKVETFSRLYLYYMTRLLQDRIGKDGAELKKTLEALQKYGVCKNEHWPYHPNKVDIEPNLEAISLSSDFRLQSFEEITPDKYKECLDKGIPIVVGMFTGIKFWTLRGSLDKHRYCPVNDTDNKLSKGHAVTIIGYDDELNGGSWIIANSMGPKWGFYGYGAIPYECSRDIGESYIITSFAGITPGRKIS